MITILQQKHLLIIYLLNSLHIFKILTLFSACTFQINSEKEILFKKLKPQTKYCMKTKIILVAFLICNTIIGQTTQEALGTHNEKEVSLFTLKNKSGHILKLTNYGARIVK